MSTTLTNTGGQTKMWRLNPLTNRAEVMDNNPQYAFPETRDYVLQLTGVSDVFQALKYQKTDEYESNIKLEFTVCRSKSANGQVFAQQYTAFVSEGSRLGKVLTALRDGKPVGVGESINLKTYLGRYVKGTVTPNQTGTRPKLINPVAIPPAQIVEWKLPIVQNLTPDDDDDVAEPDDDDTPLPVSDTASDPFNVDDDIDDAA